MTKSFALFCGFTYYAAPGWQGFHGRFATLKEACDEGQRIEKDTYCGCGWWQVVDLKQDEIVAGEGCAHTGLFGKFSASPGSDDETS